MDLQVARGYQYRISFKNVLKSPVFEVSMDYSLWRAFQSDIQGQFFAEGCGRSKKEAKNASAKVQLTDTSFQHLSYLKLERNLR